MVVPGQRLCAKIKFLEIRVLLHFAIKTVTWPVKWVETAFQRIAPLRNCELKRGTIMLLLLLKLYAVQGLFVKYERAAGASPINTLWSSLINRSLY